jgi:hypothetical protein
MTMEILENPSISEADNFQTLYFIVDSYVQPRSDLPAKERIVRLWHGQGYAERFVHLRGRWLNSEISVYDAVFVLGKWELGTDPRGIYKNKMAAILDNSEGFLIVFPYLAIEATRISSGCFCLRQAYLSFVSPAKVDTGDMIYGTMAHDIVQQVMYGLPVEQIDSSIASLIAAGQPAMELAQVTPLDVRQRLDPIKMLAQRIEKAMPPSILPTSEVSVPGLPTETIPVSEIPKPQLTEADLMMPPYGCAVIEEEETLHSFLYGLCGRSDATLSDGKVFPLELKSGRSPSPSSAHQTHIAQLSSYILIMKEKYEEFCHHYGMLFYMQNSASVKITPSTGDFQSLLILRNSLVHSLLNGDLPNRLRDTGRCRGCSSLESCSFFESFDLEETPMYLSRNPSERRFEKCHLEFYRQQDTLLRGEIYRKLIGQAEIWTVPLEKRVSNGEALENLTLCSDDGDEFRFDGTDFKKSSFRVGSGFLLMRNGELPVIGRGFVIEMTNECLWVSFMENAARIGESGLSIDRFDHHPFWSLARSNLILFFAYSDKEVTRHILDLIVSGMKPRFSCSQNVRYPGLDEEQQIAFNGMLSAEDYFLIDGGKKTGKTMVLIILLLNLIMTKCVLFVARSVYDADLFCHRIRDQMKFTRISMETDAGRALFHQGRLFVTSVSEFKSSSRAIGLFDVVVMDDAESIPCPLLLGPLSLARSFIMTGDLRLVSEQGLFGRLFSFHPEVHARLTVH